MAIRTNNNGSPFVDGEILYGDDLNDTFDNTIPFLYIINEYGSNPIIRDDDDTFYTLGSVDIPAGSAMGTWMLITGRVYNKVDVITAGTQQYIFDTKAVLTSDAGSAESTLWTHRVTADSTDKDDRQEDSVWFRLGVNSAMLAGSSAKIEMYRKIDSTGTGSAEVSARYVDGQFIFTN